MALTKAHNRMIEGAAVNVKDFGAVGDGVTDDTAAIQAAIDANKGKTILIPFGTFVHAGVLLDGSTYNDTFIVCEGTLLLKASGGSTNFGGGWVGLILKDCDGVSLVYKGDGNRTNQPDVEQIHNVGIAGASNVTIPSFDCIEHRGDALYISQSNWTASSTVPDGISITSFKSYNSSVDGRNGLSIISARNVVVDSFTSINSGGTVASVVQPGGLDIEPNFGYQVCENIVINSVLVRSAGTSGIAVLGKAITNDATRDWNCQNIQIHNALNFRLGTTGSGLAAAGLTRCGNSHFDIKDVYVGARGKARIVDYADKITGSFECNKVSTGYEFGIVDRVTDFDIKVNVRDYQGSGIKCVELNRGRFTGRIYGSLATSFAIECTQAGRGAITQTNIVYQVDAPYDGAVARAFRNEPTAPVTFSSCVARDCDWGGYANPSVQCDAQIQTRNIEGRNYVTAQPTSGAWHQGDFAYRSNNSALDGNSMFILGWYRLTTGTAHVAGTDWVVARVSNVSPAI